MEDDFLMGYDREVLSDPLYLKPGKQTIALTFSGLEEWEFIDFRALEIT